jgi:hypothetical protein
MVSLGLVLFVVRNTFITGSRGASGSRAVWGDHNPLACQELTHAASRRLSRQIGLAAEMESGRVED